MHIFVFSLFFEQRKILFKSHLWQANLQPFFNKITFARDKIKHEIFSLLHKKNAEILDVIKMVKSRKEVAQRFFFRSLFFILFPLAPFSSLSPLRFILPFKSQSKIVWLVEPVLEFSISRNENHQTRFLMFLWLEIGSLNNLVTSFQIFFPFYSLFFLYWLRMSFQIWALIFNKLALSWWYWSKCGTFFCKIFKMLLLFKSQKLAIMHSGPDHVISSIWVRGLSTWSFFYWL